MTETLSRINCLIQAAGTAAGREPELERRLIAHHLAHFPARDVGVSWRAIEPGRMFTAGATSTTSVIACAIDDTTTRASREAYMRGICDLWTEVTGCTDHEIVVSISDQQGTDATDDEEE